MEALQCAKPSPEQTWAQQAHRRLAHTHRAAGAATSQVPGACGTEFPPPTLLPSCSAEAGGKGFPAPEEP